MKLRSLQTRWTLALVAVCVLEALLIAVAVRLTTARAFEQFVVEEAFEDFVSRAEAEVLTYGTLTGETWEQSRHRERAGQSRRDRRSLSPRRLGRSIPFGLADSAGRVVRAFDGRAVGEILPSAALATGRAVIVDEQRVGTAFIPSNAYDLVGSFHTNSPEARFIASFTQALALALAIALALALGAGAWLAGRTVRPIRTLTDAARAIAAGDLRQSVPVERADEVGALAEAFNTMSTRLDEANALRQRMTADVSHDLRTPVTAVLGTLELIETGVLAPTPERLRAARTEAQRLARLVEDFHLLALADADELPVHFARLNPTSALRHAATLFEAQAHAAGVEMAVEASAVPDVFADTDRLTQVLANLIANALRHTPRGGRITLGARHAPAGVAIMIADTGEGISPEMLPRVFERSVRADDSRSGRGAGLGLSIVRSLVEAMGGAVAAASTVGEGTTVTVTLPVHDGLASETARSQG